jgi:RNA polymerase primary sigma factor
VAVLIDLADEKARVVLERGKAIGEITLDDFNALAGSGDLFADDIEDTLAALSEMGIAVVEYITQEERDRRDDETYEAMLAFDARGGHAQWTGEAWASFLRAAERKRPR